jgi:hypothetical protein
MTTTNSEMKPFQSPLTEEEIRIIEDSKRQGNWKRWGRDLSRFFVFKEK